MPIYYNIRCLSDNPSEIKELSNPTKTLKCLSFPRKCLYQFDQLPEKEQAGVILLYHTADRNENPRIYIVRSPYNIGEYLNYYDKKTNLWNYALVFVEKGDHLSLNGTHATMIDSLLVKKAKACGTIIMDCDLDLNKVKAKEADTFSAETWAMEIENMTKLLGLTFFEPMEKLTPPTIKPVEPPKPVEPVKPTKINNVINQPRHRLFYCKHQRRFCNATGYPAYNGFMVLKGSLIASQKADSFTLREQLNELIRNRIIVDDVFTQDYLFRSPSGAAEIVMGIKANGYIQWIDKDGITLNDALGRSDT